MPLDERKLDVLKAIVEDYVSTNEPVGSKALASRHQLGVSSATVRNDMALLEEEGYIYQPHTSAGRVPTDKGYRLFVDRLSTVKPLSSAERRAISQFLEGAVDLDDVVARTVRMLAQLTRQVAVVQYPRLTRSNVRHVELVPLSAQRLLTVLITDTGRVEQRTIEFDQPLQLADVSVLRDAINGALVGQPLADIVTEVEQLVAQSPPQLRPSMATLSTVLAETVLEQPEERVMLAGTANLTREAWQLGSSVYPILEALEEHVVLLKLLGELSEPSALRICIGGENSVEGLREASVVSTGYGSGSTVYAGLGVLGPTRMDYPGTISAVRAVARYVGQVLVDN
ncbi:MAG: heat-inducible transcriptional repressor HrcA [Acidimicrobiales bacterium]|nr:MAG: heat-inducible transcriptional repressor HrcA [Acidimicrobiales bacterium]